MRATAIMPGGPLLGVDWRWLSGRVVCRTCVGTRQRPPRVVLLIPAGEDTYSEHVPVHRIAEDTYNENVPVHRIAEATNEATNDELEPCMVQTKVACDHFFLVLKLAASATLVWLIWLRVVPTSTSLCALLWALYVYSLNAFLTRTPSQARASIPVYDDGALSRLLASWCVLVLVFGLLLPLALALACTVFLGSSGKAVLEITTPPIFLLAAQLLMDSTIASTPNSWSGVVAALNPVGFNVLLVLCCHRCAARMFALSYTGGLGAVTKLERGFLLANATITIFEAVIWPLNLFAYLLPKLCST